MRDRRTCICTTTIDCFFANCSPNASVFGPSHFYCLCRFSTRCYLSRRLSLTSTIRRICIITYGTRCSSRTVKVFITMIRDTCKCWDYIIHKMIVISIISFCRIISSITVAITISVCGARPIIIIQTKSYSYIESSSLCKSTTS